MPKPRPRIRNQQRHRRNDQREEDLGFLLAGSEESEKAVVAGFARARQICEHEQPDEPEGTPLDDVTQMTSSQVGRWYQYFKGMLAYAIVEAGEADLLYATAKSNHELAKKISMARQSDISDKTPAWKVEAIIADDPKYLKARVDLQKKQAYKEAMHVQVKSLEHKAELFSREITRREQEAEQS